MHAPIGAFGEFRIMRHHQYRAAFFRCQARENIEHGSGIARIQIAGGFIR
jgi:hypothetical protein